VDPALAGRWSERTVRSTSVFAWVGMSAKARMKEVPRMDSSAYPSIVNRLSNRPLLTVSDRRDATG
jgi:hypothetical protein